MAPDLAHVFLHGLAHGGGVDDIRIVAPLVPLAALSGCLTDGLRGFGRTWPYLAIEGLGKPVTRIALVVGALVAGLGLQGAIIAWGIPVAGGLLAARHIRRHPQIRARSDRGATWRLEEARRAYRPGRRTALDRARSGVRRRQGKHHGLPVQVKPAVEFWRFTAPRACQGTFQVIILWLDVLLVGAIVSRHAQLFTVR